MGGYNLVEASEGGIGGGLMETSGDMPENYVVFYVQVDDLQASRDGFAPNVILRPMVRQAHHERKYEKTFVLSLSKDKLAE